MSVTKIEKVLYWMSTLIMLILMGWAIVGYHIYYERFEEIFLRMGYTPYIIYPLAYLKLVALIIIACNRWNDLKILAYVAFFVNVCIATEGHVRTGGTPWHAYLVLICIPISVFLSNKVRGKAKRNFFTFWPKSDSQMLS